MLRAEHTDALNSMNPAGDGIWRAGRAGEGRAVVHESLENIRKVLGPDHPDTLRAMQNMAVCYKMLGRLKDAEAMFVELLQERTESHDFGGKPRVK